MSTRKGSRKRKTCEQDGPETSQDLRVASIDTAVNDVFSKLLNNLQVMTNVLTEIRDHLTKPASQSPTQKYPADPCNQAPYQVNLNVGGKQFSVSKETLCKQDSSYFTGLLGSTAWSKQAKQGDAFFIDRDPKYFKIIINYLRTNALDISKLSVMQVDLLKEELDYYQVHVDPALFHPPPLEWDPDLMGGTFTLSQDNTLAEHIIDNTQIAGMDRVMCSTEGVTSFSVKVSSYTDKTVDTHFVSIGFVSRHEFKSSDKLENLFWSLTNTGNLHSHEYDFFDRYLKEPIMNNSIMTVVHDPVWRTISFKIDGFDKGIAFTGVPHDADLCPFVAVHRNYHASVEIIVTDQ